MKTFKYLIFTLTLIATGTLAGCSDDPTYSKGGPEHENCQGVYFPSQDNAADLELDPADPTTLTFTVKRQKSDQAITVPIEVTTNAEGIFSIEPITFQAGHTETQFDITFPNAVIGETYSCDIAIVDNDYALIYGDKLTGISFSIIRVKWNLLGTGTFTYAGMWVGNDPGVPLYQRDQTNIYKLPDWGGGIDLMFTCAEDGSITVPQQYIGASNGADGPVYISTTGANEASKYDPETKTYFFNCRYFVAAGSYGTMNEKFVLTDPAQ